MICHPLCPYVLTSRPPSLPDDDLPARIPYSSGFRDINRFVNSSKQEVVDSKFFHRHSESTEHTVLYTHVDVGQHYKSVVYQLTQELTNLYNYVYIYIAEPAAIYVWFVKSREIRLILASGDKQLIFNFALHRRVYTQCFP